MRTIDRLLAPVALIALVGACSEPRSRAALDRSALDAVTSAVMVLPITTASEEARSHFLQGQRELDLGRFIEANAHFKQAVGADSTFAFAYLNVANSGNSLGEFKNNLALAERHAAHASEAERLLVQMARKGFDNDLDGQVALARQLVEQQPTSPRAFLALGDAQLAMNRVAEARTSYAKAVELTPRLFAAHTSLGNAYLFGEPRDFALALEHMQGAAALAPDEPGPHDLLGDVYRAQNNLEKARDEYTRAHELAPTDASPLQQRGHVHSFLGNYAAARADYDSAIARGRANEQASFAVYRALVSVHAGEPEAAVDELNRLEASIEGTGIPDPRGSRIFALTTAATIAIHTSNFPAAERGLSQRTTLMMQQADEVGTAAFRRSQQAGIAFFDGWLAARKGDYASARRLADRVAQLVAPDANPRKMEPVHQLKGIIDLYQGNSRAAVGHLEQGDPFDIYVTYQLALAREGAGDTAQAKALFQEVARYNFNNPGFALVRKEAVEKGG